MLENNTHLPQSRPTKMILKFYMQEEFDDFIVIIYTFLFSYKIFPLSNNLLILFSPKSIKDILIYTFIFYLKNQLLKKFFNNYSSSLSNPICNLYSLIS